MTKMLGPAGGRVVRALAIYHRLYIRNGRNIRDVTHWFVDCCSEANSIESRQRHLENFRCMLGKIHGFYLYGHEAESWTEVWAGLTAERGGIDWLRGLHLKDIGQSPCQSQRSHLACFIVKYKIREAKISQMNIILH